MKVIYSILIFTMLFILGCNSTNDNQPTIKIINNNDSSPIYINNMLNLTFSSEIDISTISQTSVYLLDSSNQREEILLDIIDTLHLNIIPKLFLKANEEYRLILTTDIKSINGVALLEQYEWRFKTEDKTDKTSPNLLAIQPLINGEYVDKFTTIALQFNESLAIDGIQKLRLTNSTNKNIDGNYREVGSYLRFIPSTPLIKGEEYNITLNPTVMDRARNVYNKTKSWKFIVGEGLDYNKSIYMDKSNLTLNRNINSIYSDENLIYVCTTNNLFIIEVIDNKLNLKSTISIQDRDIYDIAISGDYIALATDKGITILNASSHKTIKSFTTDAPVYGISYSEKQNSFYAAASSAGLYILDTNNGVITQKHIKPRDTNNTAFDVISAFISGEEYLFIAQYFGGVDRYNINGEFKENYDTNTTTRSLTLDDNKLYISSGIQGVYIIDLCSSCNTKPLHTLAFAMNSSISKDKLYVADKERGVAVFDIKEESRIAQIQNSNAPTGINSNNDIYGVTTIDDMLVTITKNGLLTIYSIKVEKKSPLPPPAPPLLKIINQTQTVVDNINMSISLTFNRAINFTKEDVNLVRNDNFGCFEHILQDINYISDTTARLNYTANRISGTDCNQSMRLDFNISILDANSTLSIQIEDTTPPKVNTTLPINGDTIAIEYSDNIYVTFNEEMNTSTITNTTVGLYAWRVNSLLTDCIPLHISTLSHSVDSKIAILVPTVPIREIATSYNDIYGKPQICNGAKYEIRVNGVRDIVGNTLNDVNSTFTIITAITPL
ncbi:MAG: Ig-like domain-containing protein [Sulfurovum sp.]